MSQQAAVDAFVMSGKYNVYTCQDLQERASASHTRQVELEQLMARAAQGAGGEFINAVAYRSEYMQVRAEMVELKRVAADKQCATESKFSSGRAVF